MATHGSLNNEMIAGAVSATPEVGMGVTQVLWTDRRPFTVIEVKTAKCCILQADKVNANPWPDGYAKIIEADLDGRKVTVRLHKDGKWKSPDGDTFTIGTRQYYYDHSF
jgi:hypothetical protein